MAEPASPLSLHNDPPSNPACEDFTCFECDTTFTRQEHLVRHLRIHTKEKPFACSFCTDTSFPRIDSLSRHYLTKHSGKNTSHENDAQPAPRTKRILRACKRCNVAKVRCDGGSPCARCVSSKADCIYEPSRVRRQKAKTFAHQSILRSTTVSSEAISQKGGDGTNEPESIVSAPAMAIAPTPTANIAQLSCDVNSSSTAAPFYPSSLVQQIDCTADFGMEKFDIGLWTEGLEGPMSSSFFYGHSDAVSLDPRLDFAWMADSNSFTGSEAGYLPTPRGPVDSEPSSTSMDEAYSRARVPRLDQDCIEPRMYRPRTIQDDAPLTFPDMSNVTNDELDDEDHAHVAHVAEAYYEPVYALSKEMERSGFFPAWQHLQIPPARVLNVWVQLYFEHFHPILPINHKPTFIAGKPHCILLFAMAAIGARYSKINNAYACASALHELVRRQTSYMCEHDNQVAGQPWMIQAILLNVIGLMYSGEKRALEVAEVLQSIPVALARRRNFFEDVLSFDRPEISNLSSERKWRLWITDEERRRLGFAIWIADSNFKNDFSLSQLMRPAELRNSLPCDEKLWNATSVGAWLALSRGSLPLKYPSMIAFLENDGWEMTWHTLGSLAKLSILQFLGSVSQDKEDFLLIENSEKIQFQQKRKAIQYCDDLIRLLNQPWPNQSFLESRINLNQQLTAQGAKMRLYFPTKQLFSLCLRYIYSPVDTKFDSVEMESCLDTCDRREALLSAGRVYELIRMNGNHSFAAPIILFTAMLILWSYARNRHSDRQSAEVPPLLLDSYLSLQSRRDWVEKGRGRPKLAGIGSLTSPDGCVRLLEHSADLMGGLSAWRINQIYRQIILRLHAKERSGSL